MAQQPPPMTHMNGHPPNYIPVMYQPPQQQNNSNTLLIIVTVVAIFTVAMCLLNMYNMHITQQHQIAFRQFSSGPTSGGAETHCQEVTDTDESSEDVGWIFSSPKMHKATLFR